MEELDYWERSVELEALEEDNKQRAVKEALAKFNFFIHITAYVSGCSFLLILGILIDWMLPYVFIPIGLWTVGLIYHGYRAFHPKPPALESPASSVSDNQEPGEQD